LEQQLAAEILGAARKVAEEAEVFLFSSRSTPVQFEANRLKGIETKERTGVALRIFREGRVGFATAAGGASAASLVDMAVETSQFGLAATFEFPPAQPYPEVEVYDPGVEQYGLERLVEIGEGLVAGIREHDPRVLCDLELTRGTNRALVLNSRGAEAHYRKTFLGLGMEAVLIEGTDMLFVGDSESSCRAPLHSAPVLDRVTRLLDLAQKKATVSTGTMPVILTPQGVASALLTPLTVAFNGKTVFDGASLLKDKLGEQVFDRRLNLWDDATVSYVVGSYPCDDEGVPGQKLPLVAGGVVSNFVYDLHTAALSGCRSTGNGRRAGGGPPQPAISSLIVEAGDCSFEDMVGDVKEGLVVEQLIGADQGNLLGGDFGGNVLLGFKVENGEIVGRVKDTMIAGNVYQILNEVAGIGSEARWVGGVLHTPALYCPSLSVTSKEI